MTERSERAVVLLEHIAAASVNENGTCLRFVAGDALAFQVEAAAVLEAFRPRRRPAEKEPTLDEAASEGAAGRYDTARLPPDAAGLKLFRHAKGDRLIACETVMFPGGRAAVDTILRRAQISGRVEIDGKIENHFADVHDKDGAMIETIALDAASYRALKTRWMPCRTERSS